MIVGSCILTASAQVSSSTYVIWNFNETKAAAKTIGTASAGIQVFYTFVFIRSNSTGETSSNYGVTTGGNYTLSSGTVTIYYPGATIPLVTYDGWAE